MAMQVEWEDFTKSNESRSTCQKCELVTNRCISMIPYHFRADKWLGNYNSSVKEWGHRC